VASSLKAGHAARYAALGRLLVKHRGAPLGAADAATELDPDGFGSDATTATEEDARHLADELVRMGPTFVKLGQLLSTRADLLPEVYLDALSRLRDDAVETGMGKPRERDAR